MNQNQASQYAATLLRISLGILFLAHGLLKVFVFTPAGTAGFFASLGLPGWLAYPTILAEVGGGLLLIVGLYSRQVALATVPILLGSIFFAHLDAGWLFSNEGGGWEFPAFWTATLFVQALLGDGAFALSSKLRGIGRSKH